MISTRGDMIVKSSELASKEKDINTTVCWMEKKQVQVPNILVQTITTN
jgi:sulfate adenylyltransferase subunit 1 (EFTu-like GTPase family)